MSTVSALTPLFANTQLQLARYVHFPLFIAGNIGNILNLIVFSQVKLRTASVCSWYFLAVSFVYLIAINTGYITRILTYMGFPDPSRTISWYCTGRVYISTLSLTLARHFLCSIVIDRFLVTSTSVTLRRLSSFRIAKWYIPLSVASWMIFYAHIWIGYSGYQAGSACKRQEGVYTLFITISSLTIETIVPITVMIIFSLLTLNNLRGLDERRNRVMPTSQNILVQTVCSATGINITHDSKTQTFSNVQQQREKKKDGKQLTHLSHPSSPLHIIQYIK